MVLPRRSQLGEGRCFPELDLGGERVGAIPPEFASAVFAGVGPLMARAAGKGVNAITVSLIVFVGLWLASTVFLIVLYTGQEELRKDNADLRKKNSQLISSAEQQSVEAAKSAGVGDQTVVGLLEGARAATAKLATGEEIDDVGRVRSKRDELLQTIRRDALVSAPDSFADASLYGALQVLYDEYRREHGLRETAEKRVAELDKQVNEQLAMNTKERDQFDVKSKGLAEEVRSAETGRASSRKDHEQAVAKLEQDFKTYRDQQDAELTRLRQDKAKLERQLGDLQHRLSKIMDDFAEMMVGPEKLATARQADGTILSAVPGDQSVYIDLGSKDRLVLGMQFAVYPREAGIPTDGRGKAQLEVVSIGDSSSECRVVRVAPNQVVLEGDIIANPAYDPTRRQNFVVVGDFDLDRDGIPDPAGIATIESIITGWGGIVADDLTALTDFVIVGNRPRLPRPASEVPPGQAEVNAAMQRALDRYNNVVETAGKLAVPVLPQDTFLNFLGFSGRRVARE